METIIFDIITLKGQGLIPMALESNQFYDDFGSKTSIYVKCGPGFLLASHSLSKGLWWVCGNTGYPSVFHEHLQKCDKLPWLYLPKT